MNAIAPALLGVALLNVYALVLILLRGPVFGTKVYRPMVWNIWLSILPAVILAAALAALIFGTALGNSYVAWALVAVPTVVWLLALPNAAYLITELDFSHRGEGENVPLWYDIVLVLTLALSGVANTLLNIFLAHVIVTLVIFPEDPDAMAEPLSWAIVAGVLVMVAFGIYLGRYLRFNSWDLRNPARFARKFGAHFSRREARRSALGFTLTHAVLLGILYLLVAGPRVFMLS